MGTCRYRSSAIAAALLAAGMLHAGILHTGPAAAAVVAATGAPTHSSVPADSSSRVTVNWTLRREVLTLAPGTISSDSLRMVIGGVVVATLRQPLSRALSGQQMTQSLTFRETVAIPRALIFRSLKEDKSLRLVRTFNDSFDDVSGEAAVEVVPAGPGSLAPAVRRLELSFDDGTRSRVVPKGERLRAVAEINTRGSGLIAGVWEAAFGAAIGETPIFRPLVLVRQGVAGGGRAVITSPPLPTGEGGTALVRFRITEPRVDFATLALQYYVTPPRPDAPPQPPAEILLTGPATGSLLDGQTPFAWAALDGAETYQLAFYAVPQGPADPPDRARAGQPVTSEVLQRRRSDGEAVLTGLFLPGTQSQATLGDEVLAHLTPKRRYMWQVTAFGADGAVIGSSALREIFRP